MIADEHLTDLGNARRLVSMYGRKVRYVPEWARDLVWSGTRWERDRTGTVQRMAKDVARQMHDDVGRLENRDEAAKLSKWAFKSESEARINSMIALARTEPGISVVPEELDADPTLFNVLNGTVDLNTGELRSHDPKDLITKIAPVEHDPDAAAPLFLQFLSAVMDGREDLITFLQRLVGCAMVGEVVEHVLVFFYGLGANGKSTLLNALLTLFGDYGKQSDPELLVHRRHDAHPTGVADLKGARMVVTSEIDAGRVLAESQVKQLTGGDRIKARFMRQDYFEFEPSHTVILAANHKPVIRGTDEAIWRRILLVPFDVTIPPADRDVELGKKLESELPGILNWAIAGCLAWQESGLAAPEAVQSATADYREDMDLLAEFLTQHTVSDRVGMVGSTELYDRFKAWSEEMGLRVVSQNILGRQLRERGFEKARHPETRRTVYLGIRLKAGSVTIRNDGVVPLRKDLPVGGT